MYKRFDCLCGNNNMFSKFGNSNLARDRQNDILYTTIRLRIYEIQQIPGMFPNIHILVYNRIIPHFQDFYSHFNSLFLSSSAFNIGKCLYKQSFLKLNTKNRHKLCTSISSNGEFEKPQCHRSRARPILEVMIWGRVAKSR